MCRKNDKITFQTCFHFFQISDLRFEISDFRFQVSDFRFQISGFRFQNSDFRFQDSYFRFHLHLLHFKDHKKSFRKHAVSAKIIGVLQWNFYHSLLTMWSTSTSNFIKIGLDLLWFFQVCLLILSKFLCVYIEFLIFWQELLKNL